MPTKHYPFGSSTAHRTWNCPAWRRLSNMVPQPPVSQAAHEGTAMHAMFEAGLRDPDYDPIDAVGTEVEGVLIEREMGEKVAHALLLNDKVLDDYQIENFVAEHTVEFNQDIGGTPDIFGWNDKCLVVGDLKTGDGVMVRARENSQLMFCAWLGLHNMTRHYDSSTPVACYIIQPTPRLPEERWLDVWETTVGEVQEWGRGFVAAVVRAQAPDAQPVAGEHCRFCPAIAICPEKTGEAHKALRMDPASLEVKTLIEALSLVESVETWARAVRKLAHEQLEQGVPLTGWKLVAKRATRRWAPDLLKRLELKLHNSRKLRRDDYLKSDLLSPAQLEKVCKQKDVDFSQFDRYIESHSSGTTIAPESDPRAEAPPLDALRQTAARMTK